MIKRMVILLYDGERLWCFDGLMDLDGPRYQEAFNKTAYRLKGCIGMAILTEDNGHGRKVCWPRNTQAQEI